MIEEQSVMGGTAMCRNTLCLMVGFALTLSLIHDASATLEGTTWEGDAEIAEILNLFGWGDGILVGGRLEFGTDGTFEIYVERDPTPYGGEYIEWECGEAKTCFIAYGSDLFGEGPFGLLGEPMVWMRITQDFAGFGRVSGQNMDAFALIRFRVQAAPLDDPEAFYYSLGVLFTVSLDSLTEGASSLGR